MGCGFSYFQDGPKYKRFYVCDYAPGGNVDGENPYKKGQPACSKHGLKNSVNYNGLCIGSGSNIAQQEAANYKKHVAAVDNTINTIIDERKERHNLVEESGKNSELYTYQWNSLFKRYFKVKNPNAYLKG